MEDFENGFCYDHDEFYEWLDSAVSLGMNLDKSYVKLMDDVPHYPTSCQILVTKMSGHKFLNGGYVASIHPLKDENYDSFIIRLKKTIQDFVGWLNEWKVERTTQEKMEDAD